MRPGRLDARLDSSPPLLFETPLLALAPLPAGTKPLTIRFQKDSQATPGGGASSGLVTPTALASATSPAPVAEGAATSAAAACADAKKATAMLAGSGGKEGAAAVVGASPAANLSATSGLKVSRLVG